jgi:membrane fusion protein, heavy metal efflux system
MSPIEGRCSGTTLLLIFVAIVSGIAVGCGRGHGEAGADPGAAPGATSAAASAATSAATAAAASEVEGGETSDLDRSVEDLMRERCEHGVPMYQCDECRYEVGVVKVTPDLLDEDGPLRTVRVVRGSVESSDVLNGEVRLDEEHSAYLSPRTPGTVRSILVDLGARVRTGQVLFTVDSPEFAEARSAYLIARAAWKLAESTVERERDLYEKRVCPRKDLLEAESARDGAAATAQATEERLLACGLTRGEILGLSVSEGNTSLPVKAPFDGTVLERNLGLGALVAPGEKLLLLGDTSTMWVWTSLYERELPQLLRQQEKGDILAHVEVPAYPGKSFTGRVERVSGVVDEATRTVKVRVVVDNREGLLRAGMFARVHLDADSSGQTLLVPAEAVLEDEGRSFVFVPIESPYFIRRPVITGRSSGDRVEVTRGLDEGDIVMGRGAFTLKSDVLRSKMGAGCAD